MERKARVPLFKVSFWSVFFFPKLPTKWKKQAQKIRNIWHKPSRRCSRDPLDIFSSPASDRAKNSQASVCSWRTTNEKNRTTTKAGVQSGVSPTALTPSQGGLWQCGGGADCSLSHRSRTLGLGQWACLSVLEFWVDPMQRKRAQWNQPCGVLRFLIYSDGVEKKLFTQLWVQCQWLIIKKMNSECIVSKRIIYKFKSDWRLCMFPLYSMWDIFPNTLRMYKSILKLITPDQDPGSWKLHFIVVTQCSWRTGWKMGQIQPQWQMYIAWVSCLW